MTIDYKEYKGYKEASPEEIRRDLRSPQGIQLTEGLFEEAIQAISRKKYEPVYSLREHENKGKPSAYQIYMHSIDETDAALKLVGSLSHWRKLCDLAWFINGRPEVGFEGLAQWRRDMADRDSTFSKQILMEQASTGSVPAARALDKLAQDNLKELNRRSPKKKGGDRTEEDGLEFLADYRG